MMRLFHWAAAALLLLCGWLTGSAFQVRTEQHILQLQRTVELLQRIRQEIAYRRLDLEQLQRCLVQEKLLESDEAQKLQEIPAPERFDDAERLCFEQCFAGLGQSEAAQECERLDYYSARFEAFLHQAQQKAASGQGLPCRLGLAAGAVAAGRKLGDRPCVQNCSDRYYRGSPEPAADPFRPGGSGHDDDPCGSCGSAFHPCQADQRTVRYHQVAVCTMSTSFSILGVVFAAAQLLLRKDAPAYAFLLSVGAALFVLLQLGAAVQELLRNILAFSRRVDGPAFDCLLRCAGILLLTDYARTLCEEAGADTLAWCAGFAGRCLVLAAAFPLLEEICQKIWGLAA